MQRLQSYLEKSAATRYMLGFEYYGTIYAVTLKPEELTEDILNLRPDKIRFRPNNKIKFRLLYHPTLEVIEPLDKFNARDIPNKGDRFEAAVAAKYRLPWHGHNSTPHWIDGDLYIKGERVQLKYQNSTIVEG